MYKFCELNENELQAFVDKNKNKHFMQTIYMNEYYKLKGEETHLVGVKEGNKVIASALIYLESRYKTYKKYAIYKGFVMDYDNLELLEFITNEIKKYLEEKNAYMFIIDPNIFCVERDSNANIIENGKDNYKVIKKLNELGYQKSDRDLQMRWTYVKDIDDLDSEEIFKTFKQNTRNIINRTINKFKLTVRDVSIDDFDEFLKITKETSLRKGFSEKSFKYYEDMSKAFKDKVVFKIAELNCDIYLKDLEKEKKEYEDKIKKINKNNKKKENYIQELGYINKRIENIEQLKKEKGTIIPLSAAMFMLYGDEIVYLSSGSYEEYLQYYGQYIIQWDIIKFACKKKYKRYNFFGVTEVFDKNNKDYGVYEFKKGFNGYVEELLGEYQYIINKKIYNKFMFISKIKKVIKKIIKLK